LGDGIVKTPSANGRLPDVGQIRNLPYIGKLLFLLTLRGAMPTNKGIKAKEKATVQKVFRPTVKKVRLKWRKPHGHPLHRA
jgi:hypothetical protein